MCRTLRKLVASHAICRALPGQWAPGAPFPELPIAEGDALELEAEGRKLIAGRARSSAG
jgi:hypothetical protein